jgi:hypothetical protein
MTRKQDSPYIWVTWITRLIMGGDSCLWAAWFKSNYREFQKTPSDFDRLSWNVKHTQLLDFVEKEYKQRFPKTQREHQNLFKYHGRSGAILSGKPDLIGFNDSELRICDVKTGDRRDEHWAQMLLYMYFFPKCYPHIFNGNLNVVGELRYPDFKQEVYMEEFDETFKSRVTTLLRAASCTEPPPHVSSVTECGFCSITSEDCAERVEGGLENRQMQLGEF